MRLKFDPKDWQGAIPESLMYLAGEPLSTIRADVGEEPPLFCWFPWCLPTISQRGSSCVGHAWANWLELMLRRYNMHEFTPDHQIDGYMIWQRGADMFRGGDGSKGLCLNEGFKAMLDLELVPPDSRLVKVANDWESVGSALLSTPLIQGHKVHDGWEDPDPESGCIDHGHKPDAWDGYHCTLRIGRLQQKGQRFYAGQNTWGDHWAWNGLFIMTEEEDKVTGMSDGPLTIQLGTNWQTWEGWKKAVVCV